MTWAVFYPDGFGKYWPSGDFTDFHDNARHYYENHMSDAEKAAEGMQERILFSKFSGKMTGNHGWVPPMTFPTVYRTRRREKVLASMIQIINTIIAVDEKLKSIIERLEPNVHQFSPLRIEMKDGTAYPGKYFILVVHNHLDTFRPEFSDAGVFPKDGPYYPSSETKDFIAKLASSTAARQDCHLWREKNMFRPQLLISDALKAEIETAGLEIFKNKRMKDVD